MFRAKGRMRIRLPVYLFIICVFYHLYFFINIRKPETNNIGKSVENNIRKPEENNIRKAEENNIRKPEENNPRESEENNIRQHERNVTETVPKLYPSLSWLFERESNPRKGFTEVFIPPDGPTVPAYDPVKYYRLSQLNCKNVTGACTGEHGDMGSVSNSGTGGVLLSEKYNLPIWDVSLYYIPPAVTALCQKYYMVIVVKSAVQHQDKRDSIRSTWGQENQLIACTFKVFYNLGIIHDEERTKKVQAEMNSHHDIIQGNFLDTYKNNTVKRIYGMKMATEICDFSFLIFADDDVFVNVPLLVDNLKSVENNGTPIYLGGGFACNSDVIRKDTKYDTLISEFPFPKYTFYVSGFGGVLSKEAVLLLLEHYKYIPMWHVDDTYIGYVLTRSGVKPCAYAWGVAFYSGHIEYSDVCEMNKWAIIHIDTDKIFFHVYQKYFHDSKRAYGNCEKNNQILSTLLQHCSVMYRDYS